jgi:photosystem II stability/assembly factor-like uncharacterized protein
VRCNDIVEFSNNEKRFLALTASGVYYSRTGVSWSLYALSGKDVKAYAQKGNYNSIHGFVCSDDYYYTVDFESFKKTNHSFNSEPLVGMNLFTKNNITYVSIASNKGFYTTRMDTMYNGIDPQWEVNKNGLEDCIINWYVSNGKEYTLTTNKGIYTSQDSAKTFQQNEYSAGATLTGAKYYPKTYQSSTFIVYTSENYGLLYNEHNAVIGSSTFTPIGFSIIQDIELAPDGSMFIGTNGFGVFQSMDNGQNWEERNKGLENLTIRDIEFALNGDLYAATKSGAYKSVDKGLNWSVVKPTTQSLYSLLTDGYPNDGLHHFVSGESTFYWLASNFNWNGGVTYGDNLDDDIYTLAYQQKKEKYWAGGRYGLWWTESDYINWNKLKDFPSYSIYDFNFDSHGRLLALTKGDIYYSDNDGVEWGKLANIPKRDLKDLLVDENDKYYVATDGGVYYSTDRGLNWIEMNDGFVNLPYAVKVDCLELDDEGHLWAGTTTTGLYRSKVPVTNMSGFKDIGVSQLYLSNVNYNSTNKLLSVVLNSLETEECSVDVIAVDGKRVVSRKIILNNDNEFGINIDLKKGMYILRLKNKQGTFSRKFIVG